MPLLSSTAVAVLILGTAEWDQPIATNQHYCARELCSFPSASVVFLESLGLRQPELSIRDGRRIMHRIQKFVRQKRHASLDSPHRLIPDQLQVRSPIVIPYHRYPFSMINRKLIDAQLRDWITFSGRKVLWTYSPVTYNLEHFADETFYHCVDMLGEFPGINKKLIETNERRLAHTGATAIGTSVSVLYHLKQMGFREPLLWENVADTDIFQCSNNTSLPRSNRAIFAGNITSKKIDFNLLHMLLDAGISISVAGPYSEGGGNDAAEFEKLINDGIDYLGMLTPTQLANVYAQSSIGLIPYKINSYTVGVSPLKTFEYLAAGLQVISSNLPGVTPIGSDILVATTRSEFVEDARRASVPNRKDITRRQRIALQHSWASRGEDIRNLVYENRQEADAI